MIMLFSRYKADFLRFSPENAANYVSILMYELQRKAPSERRKSHFRGPRFQIFPGEDFPGEEVRGLVHQSTKPLDPPLFSTKLQNMRDIKQEIHISFNLGWPDLNSVECMFAFSGTIANLVPRVSPSVLWQRPWLQLVTCLPDSGR
jgi:hypothetical protein